MAIDTIGLSQELASNRPRTIRGKPRIAPMLCFLIGGVSIKKTEYLAESISHQKIVHVFVKAVPSLWYCKKLILHLVPGQFFRHED